MHLNLDLRIEIQNTSGLSKLIFIVYNRYFIFKTDLFPNVCESIYCSRIQITGKYVHIIKCLRKICGTSEYTNRPVL
jgi:hypothetical protein